MARTRKLNIKQKRKVTKKTKVVRSAWKLWQDSLRHLWNNKRTFIVIMFVYAFLYILFVRGFGGLQLSGVRDTLDEAIGEDASGFQTATTMFGALIGTATAAGAQAGSVYQALLFVVLSLVIIWTLRQSYDGRRQVSAKQAFYQSLTPLVPYTLVWLVILLQLVPALIGTTLYGLVISNGIAVGWLENILWLLFFVILVSLSIFLLSSSLLASYIVTLRGIEPMQAFRSARKLVKFRRFMIIRKVLFLPFALSVGAVIIFLPLVFWLAAAAEIGFTIFILLLLPFAHSYLYTLYRELMQ